MEVFHTNDFLVSIISDHKSFCFVLLQGCTKADIEAISDVAAENFGLTGKEIRERSQERERKRAKQRENHQRKREADIAKLLDDHEEELTTYRSFTEPRFDCESLPTSRRWTKQKNSVCSLSRNSCLGSRSYTNLNAGSKHGVNSQNKPRLNKFFKDLTEESRKRQQSFTVKAEESKEYGVENERESSISLQMEMYYLKRCLLRQKENELTTDIKSTDKPTSLLPKEKKNTNK